ncbi:peptidoglycan-binding domain-containing protein [Streptomyces sp. NPDC058642]|uniref:peptidoglycan-binding domain-containing protein n=1 Tax=Streptomyces sp. NPDC058642 TaxID=3346572 RepID=UPI003653C407
MAESHGHLCPECGTPRGTDNTPSCGCTQRASDALRDARTAEAAAAEDFDPLRIRPYVELEGETSAGSVTGAAAGAATGAADMTMPLRAVPGPVPSTRDLSLFEGAGREGEGAGLTGFDDFDEEPRQRPRRTVLLGAAGGLVAVIAAAGLASGLFSYDTPTRNGALPQEVRASVPDASPTTEAASQSPTTTAPRPTAVLPPPSASTTRSPSPSPTPTTPSPTPSRSTASPTTSPTTSTTADDSSDARESTPPVLRRGSEGDEVVELERRLTQLGLYTRKASGQYNEGVEDAVTRYQWARGIQTDEHGVYDLATRERLESETQEP